MAAGKGISELTALTEVTGSDLFIVTDDTSGNSRKVSWTNIQASIDTVTITDNTGTAFSIVEGANNYMTIATTDSSELITFHEDVQMNQTLSLGGSGAQFFAYNEDTVKVKCAIWYSTNTRQYGQGQLWYEYWIGAIDDTAGAANRRIGFYLDLPDKGASDASGGTGAHPTNAQMYIDVNKTRVEDNLEVGDTLRIDQTGAGLRMTNVGAFDNDGSDNFRVFATNSLSLHANGETGGGLVIDDTNQNVTIDNDLIQNPSSSITPATNGELVVEATNNTTLTFKLKGSDGTVRSGTLTLS